jgi:hypothetical protein
MANTYDLILLKLNVNIILQMDKQYCCACNTAVNFDSYAKSVEHYRSAKHRNSVSKITYEPSVEEQKILALTAEEALMIMRPTHVSTEYTPMQLYAQANGQTYRIYADNGVVGKVVGK